MNKQRERTYISVREQLIEDLKVSFEILKDKILYDEGDEIDKIGDMLIDITKSVHSPRLNGPIRTLLNIIDSNIKEIEQHAAHTLKTGDNREEGLERYKYKLLLILRTFYKYGPYDFIADILRLGETLDTERAIILYEFINNDNIVNMFSLLKYYNKLKESIDSHDTDSDKTPETKAYNISISYLKDDRTTLRALMNLISIAADKNINISTFKRFFNIANDIEDKDTLYHFTDLINISRTYISQAALFNTFKNIYDIRGSYKETYPFNHRMNGSDSRYIDFILNIFNDKALIEQLKRSYKSRSLIELLDYTLDSFYIISTIAKIGIGNNSDIKKAVISKINGTDIGNDIVTRLLRAATRLNYISITHKLDIDLADTFIRILKGKKIYMKPTYLKDLLSIIDTEESYNKIENAIENIDNSRASLQAKREIYDLIDGSIELIKNSRRKTISEQS